MKLTLIKPNIGRMLTGTYIDEARMEPLPLGFLTALTPHGIEVKVYDDRMEEIPYEETTSLVGITVETYTAKRAYEISGEYRKRGVAVVMGGMHATLIPEEVIQHADAVIIGDADEVWRTVLRDAKAGKLQRYYYGKTQKPAAGVFPKREVYQGKGYLPVALTQFSRGCRFGCEFCASSVYFKKQHYCRKVDEAIREIVTHDLQLVFFVDDNIVASREQAKELFRALIPLKIRWISQGSINMTEDMELMDLMARSGCLGNVIGFESLQTENLQAMNKASNMGLSKNYRDQIEILRQFGLQTWAAFTIGHEFDTTDTIKRLLDFAITSKFAFAAFNILMPYPGTALYARLQRENRLLYDEKWWLHPDYRFNYASFIPNRMTPDELTETAFMARKEFNSLGSILRRSLDRKTHMSSLYRLGAYYAYNPLFRKEVYKKQGMLFGLTNRLFGKDGR